MTDSSTSSISETVDFYGRDFFVTKDVLRPRPETETLVDAVKSLAGLPFLPGVKAPARLLPENPVILDVGTGSGILAITLSLELESLNPTIFASDISQPALEIAKKNAENLIKEHKITFLLSDLLENVEKTPELIVANLPYVDRAWRWLSPTLGKDPQEPDKALFAEDHGLAEIKRLIEESSAKNVRYLILEADPSQHSALTAFAEQHNYTIKKAENFTIALEKR